jgi:nucleoside-diphosphate-sugar epimerase
MKIFVTGATGYVGSKIAQRLKAKGYDVIGLTRRFEGAEQLKEIGVEAVIGDLRDTQTLAQIAREVEGVIHTGFEHDGDWVEAVQVDRIVHKVFVEAMEGTQKPLIVTNGMGSFGDRSDVFDETTPIDLSFPLAARVEAENIALAAARGVRSVVIRLPLLVYGYNSSVFLPLLVNTAQRTGSSYFIGSGENRMSAVHVDDLVSLYLLALEKAPAGSVYHAASGEDASFKEIAEAIAQSIGNGCKAESVTMEQAQEIWNPVWAMLLSMSNRTIGAKANRELGWETVATLPSLLEDVRYGSYHKALLKL